MVGEEFNMECLICIEVMKIVVDVWVNCPLICLLEST